jgi:hypothetical protein
VLVLATAMVRNFNVSFIFFLTLTPIVDISALVH